jgi:hypothetical protein
MGMGCVANHNEVLETTVRIVHFQTTHIEPDKLNLHIPIPGDKIPLIIIDVEDYFQCPLHWLVEYLMTIYHDVRCYLQISHKNYAPTCLDE